MLRGTKKHPSTSLQLQRPAVGKGGGDVRDASRHVGRGQVGSQRWVFFTLVLPVLAVIVVKRTIDGILVVSLSRSARPGDAESILPPAIGNDVHNTTSPRQSARPGERESIVLAGGRVPRAPECGGREHPPSPPFEEPAASTKKGWIFVPPSLRSLKTYVNFTSIFSAAANVSAVPVPVNVRVSGFLHGGKPKRTDNRIASRSGVQKALRSRNDTSSGPGGIVEPIAIDRIYYINLEKNHQRRCIMESWLHRQPIPYERVPALRGRNDTCTPTKNGQACVGLSGLIMTNLDVMEHYNTTGMTLVLEDDFVVRDMLKLRMSVGLVPRDWDVIRFDCWQRPWPRFEHTSPFSWSVVSAAEKPYYCGGTHAVLWRNDDGGASLKRLRDVWSRKPQESGLDCQLIHRSLRSYCINVGVGEFLQPKEEASDIFKIEE